MPRLFVALRLPEDIADHLDRLCEGLPGARWTEVDRFHLTLRFIGEVDHPTFYEIGEALMNVTMPPFELQLRGLGQFPPEGGVRQLWIGMAPSDGLQRLKRQIDRAVSGAGIKPERRRFVAHVTLARFASPPLVDRLASWVARRSLYASQPFPVSGFSLLSSRLRADGAEHLVEADYDFVTGVMERA